MKKTALIIAFAVIIGFGVTACSGGGNSHKSFIGTWTNGDGEISYTISAKEIIYTSYNSDGTIYGRTTIGIDSVTSVETDEYLSKKFLENYPSGLEFEGKRTAVEGAFSSEVGSYESYVIWLHKGKKEFVISPGSTVYKKQ